ncbi:Gp49 family protein [Comamonas suwonensis]|uniref:Uncharacterized protein n=1 Tax=Comamonas suwonensis TaxID=2606214 RepID=A0A843B6L1_9BURK|nr:Gp49 family protein [Comamonas suwonensis]MBI1625155.1 hypothetical protein [Comamonas suwonensis]
MNLSFNTSPKMLLCIAAVILAVLLFCAFKVNTNPSGIALTGFIASCVALAVLALYTKIDVVIQVLRDDLEPKTGGTLGSNVVGVQRDHRNDLEYSLVHALAPHLVNTKNAAELGAFIRDVANSIQGRSSQTLAATCTCTCTCSTSMACSNCPKPIVSAVAGAAGTHWDDLRQRQAESVAMAASLTAPSVTAEQIQVLMDKLIWVYDQPEGTTTTFAHAYLGRFYVATGYSGCVSPENFDAAKGIKYAREQAEGKVRDELWKLEGYKLHSAIAGQ